MRSEIATINIIAGVIIMTNSIPPKNKCDIPNVTTILTITLVIVRATSLIFFVKQIKKIKHKICTFVISGLREPQTRLTKLNQ